jgi:uncharacterized membrane protein YagU involved in acid resistance
MTKSFFASGLIAGFITGILDIAAACLRLYLINKATPEQVLRGIAAGAFGKEAAASGNMMILWGLLFHFVIAISFAFLFFFLAKQIPALVKYPIPTGILYGIFVWAFVRYVILNYISTIHIKAFTGKESFINNAIIPAAIIVICIGIPLAFLARSWITKNKG